MVNLVIEDSSDFTFRDLMSLRGLIVQKKPHLLRVGIDSAGFHKGHESKVLSSHFQRFSFVPDHPPRPTSGLEGTIETSGL